MRNFQNANDIFLMSQEAGFQILRNFDNQMTMFRCGKTQVLRPSGTLSITMCFYNGKANYVLARRASVRNLLKFNTVLNMFEGFEIGFAEDGRWTSCTFCASCAPSTSYISCMSRTAGVHGPLATQPHEPAAFELIAIQPHAPTASELPATQPHKPEASELPATQPHEPAASKLPASPRHELAASELPATQLHHSAEPTLPASM